MESGRASLVLTETWLKGSIALWLGVAATFAGVCAASANLRAPVPWLTAVEAFTMPLATLASSAGTFDSSGVYWLLVLSGFLLWSAIGYAAGTQLLRHVAHG